MVGFVVRSIAKYSQICSCCGKRIYIGSRIERHGKRWRHAVCPPSRRESFGTSGAGERSIVYTPVSREACSESPGSLWLMAQGMCPPVMVSIGELLGVGITADGEAYNTVVLEVFDRVRCAQYNDTNETSINTDNRRRWRLGVLKPKV